MNEFPKEDNEFNDYIINGKIYKAKRSKKGVTIDYPFLQMKKEFPNLTREIYEIYYGNSTLFNDEKNIKKEIIENLKSEYNEDSELYYPKAEDFLRRCETNEQGLEIINFLLKSNQISIDKANKLKKVINEKGIRYFGEKKVWGYYERTYRNS